ncbi:MAG: UbiA family prenyltransferase, partial [Thermoplasmata archaeon]
YRGLGEISIIVTSGIMLPGMGYFVIMGRFDSTFLIFSLPLSMYGLYFIINVELPDMDSDIKGNKNTFVVRMGRKVSFAVLAITTASASTFFVLISYISIITIIDLKIVTTFSIIPLSAGIYSYYKQPVDNKNIIDLVTSNIAALIVFMIIFNLFLFFSWTNI